MKTGRNQSVSFRLNLSFLIFFCILNVCYGQIGWEWLSRLPMSKDLYSVAYGSGIFVAVGGQGIILTSKNGTDWTVIKKDLKWTYDSSTMVNLNKVIYAKNRFIAVGGCILSSTNGNNWVIDDSLNDSLARPVELTSIAYNDTVFTAVGTGGLIMTSMDGISWKKVADRDSWDFINFPGLYSVTYGNNQFLAVGEAGKVDPNATPIIMTSSDGEHWNSIDSLRLRPVSNQEIEWTSPWLIQLWSVTYGNGRYVAAGFQGPIIITSTDGINWVVLDTENINPTRYLYSTNYINSKFIAIGYQQLETGKNATMIMTSTDGLKWNTVNLPTTGNLRTLTYGNNKYVAVGQSGEIQTSPDTWTWTSITQGVDNNLRSVIYGNGIFITRGDPSILLAAPDGRIWSDRNFDDSDRTFIDGPVFGNNQFVALADTQLGNYKANNWKPVVLTSPDANNWSQHTLDTGISNFINSKIAYGNGKFVVFRCLDSCCEVRVYSNYYSSDGITWTKGAYQLYMNGFYSYLYSLSFCNGLFFTLGDSGTIITSPDGITWTKQNSNTFNVLKSVAYGDSVYVIGGENKTFLLSHDAVTWEVVTTEDGCYEDINSVAFGKDQFVAVSRNMYFSPDGRNWTEQKLNIKYNFNSILYSDNKFTAVGDIGMIIGSDDGNDWFLYHLLDKNEQVSTRILSQHLEGDSKYKSKLNTTEITAKIQATNFIYSRRLPNSFSQGEFSVELVNILGKRIFLKSGAVFNHTNIITIPAIPAGAYILTFRNRIKESVSSRIVITK